MNAKESAEHARAAMELIRGTKIPPKDVRTTLKERIEERRRKREKKP